eukprot:CAMPEP_0176487182 /NCGR_PEP_ID=MMETSP0200_2-20121128/5981_1 /TAXON_ID=947934 /ORGANISM="Chaetoceros sp., Strain GSL56" /LENGTH=1054 /DNA_ID=CAMNT_0017883965 /DNA_START=172 /DNA_END=3336 /DNA_ORIENTATION=+
MSYPAAIQLVANEFCDDAIAQKVRSMSFSGNATRTMSPEKMKKLREQNHKKERILLANSVAAEFYARTLITNPAAGCCRSYLYQRGITPAMVRTFALGFAPDAYYGYNNTKVNKNTWGNGSLVERLKELNFTTQEILDAGLATVTSRARSRLQMSTTGSWLQPTASNDAVNGAVVEKLDMLKGNENIEYKLEYEDLMDRFRRRLMVPIVDYSGQHIIGFGGRHLEIEVEDDSAINSFAAAKYLNSPDTLVFAKKNVLFGMHTASAAIEERANRNNNQKVNPEGLSFASEIATVVIVEGYFDAITLHGSGVKEVVASMGTSLTSTQLNLAAKALGGRGRIVLCLDNDEAGINAVERICTDPDIWQFLKTNGISLDVASLPSGIKDPADFIEANGGLKSSKSGDSFRKNVLTTAIPWNDWFVTRLISKYDPTDSSSFSSVCDHVSAFLSTHPNAAERTKRAYEAAGKLAELISKGRAGSSNAPLRIQLESDLLGMASRKAAAREALARRIEAADGDIGSKDKIQKLSSGEPTLSDDSKYVPRVTSSTQKVATGNYTRPQTKIQNSYSKYSKVDTFKSKKYSEKKKDSPLTEHFHGFEFSETDAQWLGLTTEKDKKKFVLGEPENKMQPVYFNSNEYLGNERSFLSAIARLNDPQRPALERASNPLVKPDESRLLYEAENRLLYSMIHYPSARLAMKYALLNQMEGRTPLLEWSSLDREWLFQCLTDSPGHEQLPTQLQEGGTPEQLKQHLMARSDVPDGAFGISEGVDPTTLTSTTSIDEDDKSQNPSMPNLGGDMRFDTKDLEEVELSINPEKSGAVRSNVHPSRTTPVGSLDELFQVDDDLSSLELREGSTSHEERAELTVQEAVAVMLKAAALRRLMRLKSEWEQATMEQEKRKFSSSTSSSNANPPRQQVNLNKKTFFQSLTDDELVSVCNKLCQNVADAMKTARELTESASQLQKRLLDYCTVDGVEGRVNKQQQQALAVALDKHVAELPDDPRPTKSGASDDYIFGSDEYDQRIDPRFGGKRPEIAPKKKTGILEQQPRNSASVYDSIFE